MAKPIQKYGMLTGSVERVCADASDVAGSGAFAAHAPPSAQPKPPVYKVLVGLNAQYLEMGRLRFALGAGMQAMAEIRLGVRTVAEYLLAPVQKAWHEAGRER
jgi:HlyD family secretion protein